MALQSSDQRNRWLIRKDVSILRQVIYKALVEAKVKAYDGSKPPTQAVSLTDADKAFIDGELAFFFTEIPATILASFADEFTETEPKTVKQSDMNAPGGVF